VIDEIEITRTDEAKVRLQDREAPAIGEQLAAASQQLDHLRAVFEMLEDVAHENEIEVPFREIGEREIARDFDRDACFGKARARGIPVHTDPFGRANLVEKMTESATHIEYCRARRNHLLKELLREHAPDSPYPRQFARTEALVINLLERLVYHEHPLRRPERASATPDGNGTGIARGAPEPQTVFAPGGAKPGEMSTDQLLIVVAISAYIVGALALFTYFLSRERLPKLIGIPFACIGCAVQFFELAYRYQTSHIWPLTNLYGSLSLFAAMSVAIFIGFAIKYDIWFIGGFVQAISASFLAYALTWNEGYLPAVPALQSYWIKVHVPLVVSSYAAFMVAMVTSVLYLIKYYGERSLEHRGTSAFGLQPSAAGAGSGGATMRVGAYDAPPAKRIVGGDFPALSQAAAEGNTLALWLSTLPSLAKLDIMTYRVVSVGLPLLTVGIITGAWWAKEAWGAYWQWDPKETAALVSWTVYALYMHLHTRNSWRGLRSAWMSVLGFLTIMFCYLGVNIWISGLHSYKM
jgi:cytochrome c-type biogenesis protein CcsB